MESKTTQLTNNEKENYTVKEVACILSISNDFAYSLVENGFILARKTKGRIYIDKDKFDTWFDSGA